MWPQQGREGLAHLGVDSALGDIADSAEGTRRIYRIDPRGIGAVREWLDSYWGAALDAFRDFVDNEEEREG